MSDFIPLPPSGGNNNGQRRGGGRGWNRGWNRDRGGRGRGRRGRGNSGGRGRGRGNHSFQQRSAEFQVNNDIVNVEEIELSGDTEGSQTVRIAIQGCAHGALDRIYETLEIFEKQNGKKIDLLLCCGDFQSLRNTTDFESMAVPMKYRDIGTFHQYYSGAKQAPFLTIFIGGNHEASNYLQELFYGGWVAPRIYYLGAAGVVRYKGLRIGGISGIYKSHDYNKGRYERPPYDKGSLRSIYHVRDTEVARLKCLCGGERSHQSKPVVDIMLSHDWIRGIEQHGDTAGLIRRKKFFEREIQENSLGSPVNEDLLHALKPSWWFAAHLHVKFTAQFRHQMPTSNAQGSNLDGTDTIFVASESSVDQCKPTQDLTDLMTTFLSLDKCLPRRHYLQVVNTLSPLESKVQHDNDDALHYDLEWLAILKKTHHWTSNTRSPSFNANDYANVHITDADIEDIRNQLEKHNLINDHDDDYTVIPCNFAITLLPHGSPGSNSIVNRGQMVGNPQTDNLLMMLGLDHVLTVPYVYQSNNTKSSEHPNANLNGVEIEGHGATHDDSMKPMPEQKAVAIKDIPEDDNEIDIDDDDDDDNPKMKTNDIEIRMDGTTQDDATKLMSEHNVAAVDDDNEIDIDDDSSDV